MENARFCHLCGRPVFEPETPEPAAAPPIPDIAQPPAGRVPLPVSFSNPIALRVAFLMSLITMLLTMIPFVQLLTPVWLLVAGSSAVLLYRRLTGMQLTVGAGARLGSITGVLAFASLVITAAITVPFNNTDLRQEMVKQNPDAAQFVNNPALLGFAVLLGLLVLFAIVVGMCTAGGALGARFGNRNAKV